MHEIRINRCKIAVLILAVIIVCISNPVVAFGGYGDSTGSKTFKDFDGARIGIITGSAFDTAIVEAVKDPQLYYYNVVADQVEAIKTNKLDAMVLDDLQYRFMTKNGELDDFEMIEGAPGFLKIAFCFARTTKGNKVLSEFNEFLKVIKADGRLDQILGYWLDGKEYNLDIPSLDELTGENGTIKVATAAIYPPFNYIENGEIIGYEPDILHLFAKEYGYKLDYYDMTFDSIMVGVATGKFDIGSSGTYVTEERQKGMDFCDVVYDSKYVLLYAKDDTAKAAADGVNAGDKNDGFYRTFIEDNRWMLFVKGIGRTLLITFLSMLLGTILGFVVYLLCRKGNKVANGITNAIIWLIQGIPMVVLLMVFFYIIFGKSQIGGIWVAVIGFTLTFGAAVFQMIAAGVKTVDLGQSEAAYTVGYSDIQTFFKIILPQAAQHFIGTYRVEAVFHLKATGIVGYIAVQDLTKVSDIVRSITYEPFYPLIATAVIYIVIGAAISAVFKQVQVKIDPMRRSREDYLKGVNR